MGLGANTTAWFKQIPEFARSYLVIAFDNRGAGRSEKPDEPYTIAQMADDAAALLEELGVRSAHVFGMSLGGMVAQELALRHPGLVRTLVLGATSCGGPHSLAPPASTIQQMVAAAALPLEQAIEAGQRLLYSESFYAENRDWLLAHSLEHAHLLPPPYALQRQVMAAMTFDAYGRLDQIRVPVLVLSATDDKIVPAANQRLLAARIPGARLVEFPGAGHGLLVECADAVNQAVLGFLREHDQRYVPAGE